MDYLVEITNLIRLAKHRQIHCPLVGYKEKHHILPKSIGKLLGYNKSYINRKDNIVQLTAAEHFKIHVWLYEWFKEYYGIGHLYTIKIIQGLNRLLICKPCKNVPNINITAEEYERIRIAISDNIKEGYRNGTIIKPWTGKKHSKETKEKQSRIMKEKYKNGTMINANKGKPASAETKEKMSNAAKQKYSSGFIAPMKGRKHSKESLEKMSLKHKINKLNGYVPPYKGKKYTEERKLQMSKISEKYLYEMITETGELFKITNLCQFCKLYNLDQSIITRQFIRKANIFYKGFKILNRTSLNNNT